MNANNNQTPSPMARHQRADIQRSASLLEHPLHRPEWLRVPDYPARGERLGTAGESGQRYRLPAQEWLYAVHLPAWHPPTREQDRRGQERQAAEQRQWQQRQPILVPIHECEMKRWEKDGRIWYSHKVDGKWCTGK
jgi:hypothetical protein